MNAKSEMILGHMNKFYTMHDWVHSPSSTIFDAAYANGWLCGAMDAISAILDDDYISYLAYDVIREKYKVSDAKERLRDYIENDDEYDAAIKAGVADVVAQSVIMNYDLNVSESDQFDIAIEKILRKEN